MIVLFVHLWFVLLSFNFIANNEKKIKEIVCRNLENKETAKKLVDDYNSRYGKVTNLNIKTLASICALCATAIRKPENI